MNRLLVVTFWLCLILAGCASTQKSRQSEETVALGFRVQLMQTSDVGEANHYRRLAILRFEEEVYTVFEPPYYKIRVGDFVNEEVAEEFRKVAQKKGFQEAWVVGSKIKVN